MSETHKINWGALKAGDKINLPNGCFKVLGRGKRDDKNNPIEVVYLKSDSTGINIIAVIDKYGSVDFKFPPPLTIPEPGTVEYEHLHRKVPEFPDNPKHVVFEGRDGWKVEMACGHNVKDYMTCINKEDHSLMMKYICEKGCESEWYDMNIIPLPYRLPITCKITGSV